MDHGNAAAGRLKNRNVPYDPRQATRSTVATAPVGRREAHRLHRLVLLLDLDLDLVLVRLRQEVPVRGVLYDAAAYGTSQLVRGNNIIALGRFLETTRARTQYR